MFTNTKFILPLAAAVTLLFAFGCGPSDDSTLRGILFVNTTWPHSRVVPSGAKSVVFEVTNAAYGVSLKDKATIPPAPLLTTRTRFDLVGPGTVTVKATAYPNEDGTGVAQATGTSSVQIVSGKMNTVDLTMGSTIASLRITGASTNQPPNKDVTYGIQALDASGAVVLVDPTVWKWTVEDPTVATIAPNGDQVFVHTLKEGLAKIHVTDPESGKTSGVSVTVTSTGGITVPIQ